MRDTRCLMILALTVAFACTVTAGCGSAYFGQQESWRQEVDDSLAKLEAADSFHYRLRLERWVGVSGKSVFGDESGEGSWLDHNFSIQLLRHSPAGDKNLLLASWKSVTYLQDKGEWRRIEEGEAPSPLCDPRRFLELASTYGDISLEEEEEHDGKVYHRYLLLLSGDRARELLSQRTWSYFSNLRYELRCRILISDGSSAPASIELEALGYDAQENLLRYRLLATVDLYDLNSPAVQLTVPLVSGQD
ncbi:MAG: hypothetical protein SWK76_04330 [Actinomycetota bacterium]|nr:hypothetical protein [Actinomycetota bacterium]